MKLTVLMTAIGMSFVFGTAHGQEVYKIEKEDGTVVYTDTPSKQSEPVTFKAQTSNVADSLAKPKASSSSKPQSTSERPTPDYKIAIKQPKPDATIRNNNGAMTITSVTQPKASGTYRLLMDGKLLKTSNSGTFSLSGIHRGAHTFSVKLTNKSGKTLASSKEQTFYMHQASALINTQNSQ